MKKILYQTLENRDNVDEVEQNGPFLCKWENTWLGDGYYFWDTFVENAHWWGQQARFANNYFICKAIYDFDTNKCFDLVGTTEHLQEFNKVIKLMKEKKLITKETTVSRIIHFLKQQNIFHYQAIRVYGLNSKSMNSAYHSQLIFEVNRPQYLDLTPAIQLCIYNKKDIKNYKVIYPEEYSEEGVF